MALTHSFFPYFDWNKIDPNDRATNFKLAFDLAEEAGDVPKLLDWVDMVQHEKPDPKCVYTYITEFYNTMKGNITSGKYKNPRNQQK